MDAAIFQYAVIPMSLVQTDVGWITKDDSSNYQRIDSIDLPQEMIDKVFDLYQKSYSPYTSQGVPPLFTGSDQLLKYNRWILVYSDDDPDKNIVSFFLFKTTDYGLKSGITGSNGARPINSMVKKFKVKSLNLKNVFGEVSGRLEEIIIKEVPVVDYRTAKKILSHFGKTDVKQKTGNHYSRSIGNLGVVTKIMVGNPTKKN